jgi:septal ring factor EnvC (AmiA/AmiB activator)
MRNRLTVLTLIAAASVVFADAYATLLKRYEAQIRQQEKQLKVIRKNLIEKEQEAKMWQVKAEAAKTRWTQAGLEVENARRMVRLQHERRQQSRVKADAAEWSVIEHTSVRNAASAELAYWVAENYKEESIPHYFDEPNSAQLTSYPVMENLGTLSQTREALAEQAQKQETALRIEEMRWQEEEQKQTLALDKYRHTQQSNWLRWQEAVQKRQTLEEERAQLEQSAQALRVMLAELHEHRDQTMTNHQETPHTTAALTALRGTLPWPAAGQVTQNFGKHYSDKMQQLIISNGIRVQADAGKPVRAVQPGKVLFARPFQQYGQLVIVQHQHGLTSVYGELGQTQVKEGDLLATLDPVGTVGANRSFYFELRHDEEPINPLVWLAPAHTAVLSEGKKF